MRANCLIPLSLYEDHDESARAQVVFRKEETRRERLVLPSSLVSRFVFPRGALFEQIKQTTFIKERCVLGKNPRFCLQGACAFRSLSPRTSGLSLSLFTRASQKRARECVLARRVSSVLGSLFVRVVLFLVNVWSRRIERGKRELIGGNIIGKKNGDRKGKNNALCSLLSSKNLRYVGVVFVVVYKTDRRVSRALSHSRILSFLL